VGNWPDFRPNDLLRSLIAHGVDFVVIGGIAMIAQGSSRLTQDLDISYAPDSANLKALGETLLELNARLRGIGEKVPFTPDERTLRRTQILCLETDQGPLDLLLVPPGAPPYEELRTNADRVEIAGMRVLVASLEDLAAMKRAAKRPMDKIDLEILETIEKGRRA
jgi:predicted nucleotidyltransferase